MEIVAGTARGLILSSPGENDEVRPTSVRARRAFFDSLGDLSGLAEKNFAIAFSDSIFGYPLPDSHFEIAVRET